MRLITGFTDQPNQHQTLTLLDGSKVDLTLRYKPQQTGWFFDLAYTEADGTLFQLLGARLCTFPNILRQWINLLPFGILVQATGNVEPLGIEDLVDGTANLYLLEDGDLSLVEMTVFIGP